MLKEFVVADFAIAFFPLDVRGVIERHMSVFCLKRKLVRGLLFLAQQRQPGGQQKREYERTTVEFAHTPTSYPSGA